MKQNRITNTVTFGRKFMFFFYEQALVFERKVEIFCRSAEWGMENERLYLVANISDHGPN